MARPGPTVPIADGAQASPGDLLIPTRNEHALEAGEQGWTLANHTSATELSQPLSAADKSARTGA